MDPSELSDARKDPYFAKAIFNGSASVAPSTNSNPTLAPATNPLLPSKEVFKLYAVTSANQFTCVAYTPLDNGVRISIFELDTDTIIGADKDSYFPVSRTAVVFGDHLGVQAKFDAEHQKIYANDLLAQPRYILAIEKNFASLLFPSSMAYVEDTPAIQSIIDAWIAKQDQGAQVLRSIGASASGKQVAAVGTKPTKLSLISDDPAKLPPTIPFMASAFIGSVPGPGNVGASNSKFIAVPYKGIIETVSMNAPIYKFKNGGNYLGIYQTFLSKSVPTTSVINTLVLRQQGTMPAYTFYRTVYDVIANTCSNTSICQRTCFTVPQSLPSGTQRNLLSQANTMYSVYLFERMQKQADILNRFGCVASTGGTTISASDSEGSTSSTSGSSSSTSSSSSSTTTTGGTTSTTGGSQGNSQGDSPSSSSLTIPPIVLIAIGLILAYFLYRYLSKRK